MMNFEQKVMPRIRKRGNGNYEGGGRGEEKEAMKAQFF